MPKTNLYRQKLRTLADWDAFLMQESGLPGPRGNLELAQAVVEEGDAALFHRYLALDPARAPENSPGVFLAFCGAVGLGKLLAQGDKAALPKLRTLSHDPRWRIREGVAMALQRYGEENMVALLQAMQSWAGGDCLEQRAAAAALCEPRLLADKDIARQVLAILDEITASIELLTDRKDKAFQVLRKSMGYCWSVAVVATPEVGKPMMEKWMLSQDRDIRWIMRENLKKARLERMDASWVEYWKSTQ